MIYKPKSLSLFALAALVSAMSGCGGADIPDLGEVKGTVMMNGEPIVGIDVVAYPAEGRPAYGKTDEKGAYTIMFKNGIAGTKVGQNRITPMYVQGGKSVPPEYAQMMFDIKPGENSVDFDMKSDAPEWNGGTAKKPKKTKTITAPD